MTTGSSEHALSSYSVRNATEEEQLIYLFIIQPRDQKIHSVMLFVLMLALSSSFLIQYPHALFHMNLFCMVMQF